MIKSSVRGTVAVHKLAMKSQLGAVSGRGTGILAHLNKKLRAIADKVTCFLPIDRDDFETMKACAPQ